MKKLPIDVSNFRLMIEGDYIYVDKTRIIYELLSKKRLFFLSRPRRFGKSLLVSLFKELYSGNKELFKDTWIGKHSDYQWVNYSVLHFDFSKLSIQTSTEFTLDLSRNIERMGLALGVDVTREPLLATKLTALIDELSKKNKVAILIDEYDYPLVNNIENLPIARSIQKTLRSFFSTIKGADTSGQIQGMFITGVTKFSKTSLFSGMNNLVDLTMHSLGAVLLGYTKEELTSYFGDYLAEFAQAKHMNRQEIFDKIQAHYNGYRFAEEDIKVYNPFSVLHCLDEQKFRNYWFESGTPWFVVQLIKKQLQSVQNLEKKEVPIESLGTFDIENIRAIPILFQAGYLTIHEFHEESELYVLGYPNVETRDSFHKYLLVSFSQTDPETISHVIINLKKALDNNNIDVFCTTVKSLIANIPYQIQIGNEIYYHSMLQFLMSLLGYEAQSEISSNKGRIDLVVKTDKRIYIFEFKYKATSQEALEQIETQGYPEKYLYLKKPMTLVGISFNVKKKELFIDWVKKEIESS